LFALTVSTWFTGPFKIVLQFGVPWLIFLCIVYLLMSKFKRK
jgi:hypothetical protein